MINLRRLYQRLLDLGILTVFEKEKLAEKFNSLNPIELRKDLSFQLKRFKNVIESKSD